MSFVVIFVIIIASLFATAFFTKRRFGVLGLALAAGGMLSSLWVGDLTPIIRNAGLVIVAPPLESVVAAALILLPAVILLFSGPTYRDTFHRIVGALAFAMLATALLLEPLGSALVIEGVGRQVYDFFVEYKVIIITVTLVLAIIDVLMTRTPRHHPSAKH